MPPLEPCHASKLGLIDMLSKAQCQVARRQEARAVISPGSWQESRHRRKCPRHARTLTCCTTRPPTVPPSPRAPLASHSHSLFPSPRPTPSPAIHAPEQRTRRLPHLGRHASCLDPTHHRQRRQLSPLRWWPPSAPPPMRLAPCLAQLPGLTASPWHSRLHFPPCPVSACQHMTSASAHVCSHARKHASDTPTSIHPPQTEGNEERGREGAYPQRVKRAPSRLIRRHLQVMKCRPAASNA